MVFILAGIVGGFLYWRIIGCNSGTCPITANWHTSSILGGIMGYLGGSSIQDIIRKKSST